MASDDATLPTQAVSGALIRGAFIVLEGLDRSGKTTQAKLLEQRLVEERRPVQRIGFPDRTTAIGKMIDSYLKSDADMEDHVIHLLFSANRWEAANRINALLEAGITVISDRYYHSGIVYSAAKRNPSLPLSWARAPERGLPRPDMVLFLDLEESEASLRGDWGAELYEKAETQRIVRELFWTLSMGGKDREGKSLVEAVGGLEGPVWRTEEEDLVIVDAGSSVERVAESIWNKVKVRLEEVTRGEVGRRVRTVE